MQIINLSELSPEWHWLKDEFVGVPGRGEGQQWHHITSLAVNAPRWMPKKITVGRVWSACQAIKQLRQGSSVLVSHGPRPAMYAGLMAQTLRMNFPHLVYSFNFTNLPGNTQRKLMTQAFKQATRFVCYSSMERQLYADVFNIPEEKIDMLHWAVHAPDLSQLQAPVEQGDYICALGSQARDYATLFAAMKRLPAIRLVIVATKDSIAGLDVPDNVKVYTHIPSQQAFNLLAHSRMMVVPLHGSEVPCGHVTIVAGMFHRKAIIATDSTGVYDYVKEGQTGLFYPPGDVDVLASRIQLLWEDRAECERLAQQGYMFAHENCTANKAVDYFDRFLKQYAV